MAWLSGWMYRKKATIGQTVGAGTDYQLYIIVHYGSGEDSGADVYLNGKCKSDFGDIRITRSDGVTVIAGENNGWMEEKVDGDYAKIWFKLPDDLDAGNVDIYVYYGNSEALWNDDPLSTFYAWNDGQGLYDWEYEETDVDYDWETDDTIYVSPPSSIKIFNKQYNEISENSYGRIKKSFETAGESIYIQVKERHNTTSAGINTMYKIWLDDEELFSQYTYNQQNQWFTRTFTRTPASGTHALKIGLYAPNTTSHGNNLWVDDVIVRKYVSPEPEIIYWGEEELQTRTVTVTNERLDKEVALLGDLVTYTAIVEADGDAVPDEFIARLIGDSFVMKDNIQFVDAVYDSLTHRLTVTFTVRYGVTRLYWRRWTQISPITVKYPYQTPTGLAWESADT